MSAELIVLSIGAAASVLIVTRVLSRRADARGVRDLRDPHEMFLGAPGPPLTEAVRQKAVP